MSSDIYARPDLSKKVRYNRKVKEDNVEWEEREVVIYESADAIRDDQTDFQSSKGGPHTEKHRPSVQRRPFRAATLCLGVLCFLMLTGIIILSIRRAQTQKNRAAVKRRCFKATTVTLGVMYLLILAGTYIRYILVTLEKTQLQTRNDQLSKNYSQLQGTLSVNNSQFQSNYEAMSKNHSQLQDKMKQLKDKTKGIKVNNSQLQDEVKQLKAKIEGKCPEGWRKFGYSCYFKSNEWKTWYDSRSYCQNKGADLVIINYEEEQKFVKELNLYGESWIGLQGTNGKWTGSGRTGKWVWEWKWVDSSPLTQMFWASGMPYGSQNQYTAACCDTQGKWKVSSSYDTKNWICEK
ncbi:C-type lectin domain family 4 member M-like isoform X4 [Dicentrarchus labrax]|uniref:C-type lectin domain family 4 member M-like isoform X4 n=1 Tax=Dicentrarchus labrax TaxID=13489 RepID=UPI0021F540F1|nr:C-type lectin domain family 4 member M-like isoform X4 [Dicentrarchus labrax]